MKNLSCIFLITLLALFVFVTCKETTEKTKTQHGAKTELQLKIDSIGKSYIDDGTVLGFSVAVLQENDTLYNGGFGHLDTARTKPVTQKTIFLLASISKLVGATMVMKLVEEGKLSLEQTLYELLPDYPNAEQAQKIKLRHLLSHTSGLPEYSEVIDSVYVKTRVAPTKNDIYAFLKDNESLFEPSENYCYNNSGFLLMGMIVEQVTGNSFQSELDRIINTPTGLHLKLIAENTHNTNMSPYYELHGERMVNEPHWTWIKGDGGMTTSAIELAHFPFKWANGDIISRTSYRQMITPTILSDSIETGYGLGVRKGTLEGYPVHGHTGGHKTTKSKMVFFPDKKLSIVVMVNTDNTPTHANKIFGDIALAVLGKKMPDFSSVNKEIDELVKFEGTYQVPGGKGPRTIRIVFNDQDSHLYYRFGDNDTKGEKMYHLGKGEFWIERWPLDRVVFNMDRNDQVRALREYYYGFYVTLRKKNRIN